MAGTYIPRSVIDRIASCGIDVRIWDGAEGRSASQGGFSSLQGVVMHHTADQPPHGDSSWNYATHGNDNSPEYNFGVDLSGKLNWLAAGGVNSSGKGGALQLQTGYVPVNGANYRLPAISVDIDGVGEVSSKEMIITCVVTAVCLLQWMSRQTGDCTAHKEYCGPGTTTPGRKIDPFGPWEAGVYGTKDWGPQQGRIDAFREQLFWAWGDPAAWVAQQRGGVAPSTPEPEPEPTPPPKPEEDWMADLPTIKKGDSGAYVKRMQHLLAAAGYMNEGNTANYDGVWGNGTDSAKVKFDNAFGLTPSPPTDCGDKSWESLVTGKKW